MVDEKVYDKLKKEFGQYSSWAIWQDSSDGRPRTDIEDLSIFDDPYILDKLNVDYVFVGLNAAKHDRDTRTWGSFHSEDRKRQNDFKLRYAFKGTKFWGSYITDVIKDYPETNSSTIMKAYRSDSQIRDKAIRDLNKELEIIGGKPVLIAFGNYAFRILKKMEKNGELKNVSGIVKLKHYSCYISKENYKKEVENILANI